MAALDELTEMTWESPKVVCHEAIRCRNGLDFCPVHAEVGGDGQEHLEYVCDVLRLERCGLGGLALP